MSRDITALQNHLFSQLEKIIDEDLNEIELMDELKRAKGVTDISRAILETIDIQFRAEEVYSGLREKPRLLE